MALIKHSAPYAALNRGRRLFGGGAYSSKYGILQTHSEVLIRVIVTYSLPRECVTIAANDLDRQTIRPGFHGGVPGLGGMFRIFLVGVPGCWDVPVFRCSGIPENTTCLKYLPDVQFRRDLLQTRGNIEICIVRVTTTRTPYFSL